MNKTKEWKPSTAKKTKIPADDVKNEKGLTKPEWIETMKTTHGDKDKAGDFIWKAKKVEQPKYTPDREYEHVKKFPSIVRDSSAIFEEKIDGSNMCWVNEVQPDGNLKLKFYSRNWELDYNNPANAFWKPFIDFLREQNAETPFEPDYEYFGEAVGQAKIPYWHKKVIPAHDRLFLFDVRNMDKTKELGRDYWYKREYIEELAKIHGLSIAPVIKIEDLDDRTSQVDPNVEREGFISTFEYGDGERIKVKHVEVDLKGHGYQPSLSVHFNPKGTYDTEENKKMIAEQKAKYKNAWVEQDKNDPDKVNFYNQGIQTATGKYKKTGWLNLKNDKWSVANINMLVKNHTLNFMKQFKEAKNKEKFYKKPKD